MLADCRRLVRASATQPPGRGREDETYWGSTLSPSGNSSGIEEKMSAQNLQGPKSKPTSALVKEIALEA